MLTKADMRGHQSKVSDFIVDNKDAGVMCWLDIGGGKTGATLDALSRMEDEFCFNKALVVSTKQIVQKVWPVEVKNWEQSKHFTVVTREQILAVKTNRSEVEYLRAYKLVSQYKKIIKRKGVKRVPPERLKAYRAALRVIRKIEVTELLGLSGDIHLINVENLVWLIHAYGTKWPYDTVILDEQSLFRNPASKRFKAFKQIRPYVKTVIGLTGTPAPNGYMGLWSQAYMIDQGERLGKTITEYRNRYFHKHYNGFSWVANEGAEDQIQEKLKDIVVSLDPKDYMELGPEPIHDKYNLTMPPKLYDKYKELEREFYLEVKDEAIAASTEAVKSNKLRQFCNGAVYAVTEDDDTVRAVNIHNLKIDALKDIVETSNGQPLIVAYEFKPEKEKILNAFPKAITINEFDQDKWDKGLIPMMVVHPRSGGHGLSLQHGGHKVVWFSTSIDLELFDQLNGRVGQVRQAQSGYFKAPVYTHIYFDNTVEQDLMARRGQKDINQKGLLKAMRKGIKSRLVD